MSVFSYFDYFHVSYSCHGVVFYHGHGKLTPSKIFMEGELENRSGAKEGFKGKHEVASWLIEAKSWTVESNCLSPVEAKYRTVESKRKKSIT